MVLVDPEVHEVGQRVLLGVDPAGPNRTRQLARVDRHRLEAERAEDLLVERVVLGADAQARAVRGSADRPGAVGEVADAVVPEGERKIAGGLGDRRLEPRAERPVERRIQGCSRLDHERQIEHPERRGALGKIARREIAHVECAALHELQQVGGLMPECGDVRGDLARRRRRRGGARARGRTPRSPGYAPRPPTGSRRTGSASP